MDIRPYIEQATRTYSFRLRSVVILDDVAMSKIEKTLLKYNPLDITNPVKTLFQKNPLDFVNVQNAEVYIIDFELGLPVAASVVQYDIIKALSCASKFIIVRGDNEPSDIETNRMNAMKDMDEEAATKGLTPAALLNDATNSEYEGPSGDQLYGTNANSVFLDYLKKVEDEKKAKMKVDPANPLFKWLDMPAETPAGVNFNAHIKDAPFNGAQKVNDLAGNRSADGNFDDDKKFWRKAYIDKNGKTVVLSRQNTPIRKEK